MSKKKGIAAERELLHLLWDRGFGGCRVAGSGSAPHPSCDLIVGDGKRRYAIECKTSHRKNVYLNREQVENLKEFAGKIGAVPLIAMKFAREQWRCIKPEKLEPTEKGLVVSIDRLKKIGKSIDQL